MPTNYTRHSGTPPAGALTTIWTPPCTGGPMTWDDHSVYSLQACMPPGYWRYVTNSVGYYSPGICPSGYWAACERYTDRQGPELESGETAMLCAPSGFTCAPVFGMVSNAIDSTSNQAPMIQIRFASSDLSLLETHPLTPGVTPTERLSLLSASAALTQSRPTAAETTAASDGQGDGSGSSAGLPHSVIAGIAIGGVGTLALVALVIMFFLRHRKKVLEEREENSKSYEKQQQPGWPASTVTGQPCHVSTLMPPTPPPHMQRHTPRQGSLESRYHVMLGGGADLFEKSTYGAAGPGDHGPSSSAGHRGAVEVIDGQMRTAVRAMSPVEMPADSVHPGTGDGAMMAAANVKEAPRATEAVSPVSPLAVGRPPRWGHEWRQ